jgi:hypothetical protein
MKRKWALIVAAALLVGVAGSVAYDASANGGYTKIPSDPKEPVPSHVDELLWALENGREIDPGDFDTTFQFVRSRYDCSDFRLQSLLRILYLYEDRLDDGTKGKIRETLLNFKYWMDEPGADSMCYWSENHQILFAAAEYLAGRKYPDDVFANNGMTGRQHMEKARARIMTWMEQRWLYGFTEWYSNTYYVEDIAPMSNLIDFSGDEEIRTKMSIIMDLLLYDMASQSYKGTFVTTSGRLYEGGKKSGRDASTRSVTEHVFGYDADTDQRMGMDLNFIYIRDYEIPEVIRAIGRDERAAEIRASSGLDVAELKGEGLVGPEDRQIMMQWGMEAFTNAPVITNSVNYIRKNKMFGNEFLYDFKDVNYTLLVKLGLLPVVSRVINPQTNGVAIQRANTYTYRTPWYSMATAQQYHPGDYGDQQQVSIATFGNELSIFNNHPAVEDGKRGPNGSSPLYWVGYGHLPHSAQDRNVNLSLYVLPGGKGLMEKQLLHYTHEYFPKAKFDDVVLDGRYAFARYGDAYVALIGRNELRFAPGKDDDLLQDGRETYWITELGDRQTDGAFDGFMDRIRSNRVEYGDRTLTYASRGKEYRLVFGREFTIDGATVDTNYKRFSSPWAEVDRKAGSMRFACGGHSLYLDFYNGIRERSER